MEKNYTGELVPTFGRNKTQPFKLTMASAKEIVHNTIKIINEQLKDNSYIVIIGVLVLIIILLFIKNVRDI